MKNQIMTKEDIIFQALAFLYYLQAASSMASDIFGHDPLKKEDFYTV